MNRRDIYDLQQKSAACAFCSTPLTATPLSVSCPSSTSSIHCPARFCSRLCLSRGTKHTHPLLCPAQNPASAPLLAFVKKNRWMGLHALVQVIARLLIAAQSGEEGQVERDWDVVSALAELSLEDRAKSVWSVTSPISFHRTLPPPPPSNARYEH